MAVANRVVVDRKITVVYTLVIMSNLTVLNIKIDKDLKAKAQNVALALGLPMSTIVAASLRDVIRTRSITISDQPSLRPEIEAELLQLSANAKKGIGVSPTFNSVEESFVWLDKQLAKERKSLKTTA